MNGDMVCGSTVRGDFMNREIVSFLEVFDGLSARIGHVSSLHVDDADMLASEMVLIRSELDHLEVRLNRLRELFKDFIPRI